MRPWDRADAIEAVWRSELPSTTRLLALAMCWEANEAGVVTASQLDLAMMMHATDRAVRTHLKALVRAGTITEIARTTSTWWRIEWGVVDTNTSDPDPPSAPPFPLSQGAEAGSGSPGSISRSRSIWTHDLDDAGGELGDDEDDVGMRVGPRPEPSHHVPTLVRCLAEVIPYEPPFVRRHLARGRCSDTVATYLITRVSRDMPHTWWALSEEQRLADVVAACTTLVAPVDDQVHSLVYIVGGGA